MAQAQAAPAGGGGGGSPAKSKGKGKSASDLEARGLELTERGRGDSVDRPVDEAAAGGGGGAAAAAAARPTKLHQDVLRSMSLHTTLVEGLKVDYNLAFLGSICTGDQKVSPPHHPIPFSFFKKSPKESAKRRREI